MVFAGWLFKRSLSSSGDGYLALKRSSGSGDGCLVQRSSGSGNSPLLAAVPVPPKLGRM